MSSEEESGNDQNMLESLSSVQVKLEEEEGDNENQDFPRLSPAVPDSDSPSPPDPNTTDDQQDESDHNRASGSSLMTVDSSPPSITSEQHQHPAVGSSSGQVNSTTASTSRRVVKLVKGRVEQFGFTLEPEADGTGFVIRSLTPRGIAAKSKSLHVGMKVHAINDEEIDKLPLFEVNYLIEDSESQINLLVDGLPAIENILKVEKFGSGQSDSARIKKQKVGSSAAAKITVRRNKAGKFIPGIGGASSRKRKSATAAVCKKKKTPFSSSSSSSSSTPAPPSHFFIILRRGHNEELGFELEKVHNHQTNGFVISSILRRGVAARSSHLRVGLRVLSINQIMIDNLSEVQVDHLITSCGNQVMLEVDNAAFQNGTGESSGLFGMPRLFPAGGVSDSETVAVGELRQLLEEKDREIEELERYRIEYNKIVHIVQGIDN